jgi:parallel beta-helix repeat protein
MVFLMSASGLASLGAGSSESGASPRAEAHSPIYINGDADFANQAAANGWNGTGTSADPYIIENYDINGFGAGYSIRIMNTRVNFSIQNCTLHDASGGGGHPGPWGDSGSLDLENVMWGTVWNCTITRGNWWGLLINGGSNNNITNCTFSNLQNYPAAWLYYTQKCIVSNSTLMNGWGAFEVRGSSYNRFENINFSGLNGNRMNFMEGSNYNTVNNCDMSNGQSTAVYIQQSHYNNITNNLMVGCNGDKVDIYQGSYNNISGNNFSFGSSWVAMYMSEANYNSIYNNDFRYSSNYGLLMDNYYSYTCNHNVISGNNFSLCGKGIDIESYNSVSYNNTIVNNDVSKCLGTGADIRGQRDGLVANNRFNSNPGHGLYIWNMVNCTITNNTMSDNSDSGLCADSMSSGRITNNTARDNRNCGFQIVTWTQNNVFSGNDIRNNTNWGVYSYGENRFNNWTNNTFAGSIQGVGILLNCHNNIFRNNTFALNQRGLRISGANNCMVYNNNFLFNGGQANNEGLNNSWNATSANYPLGGNYWSDYRGTKDSYSGPSQNIPGSDGIGELYYYLDTVGAYADKYPLMQPAFNDLPVSSVDALPKYWFNSPVKVSVTASDGREGVGSVKLFYNYSSNNTVFGPRQTLSEDLTAPWVWFFPFQEGEGHYRFISQAFDVVMSPEKAKNVTEAKCGFDATRPSVSILFPAQDQEFRTSNVSLKWNGSDALSGIDHFELKLDGKDWVDVGKAMDKPLKDLPDRPHNVVIRAVDEAGNFNESSVDFKVDSGLPFVDIIGPMEGQCLDHRNVTVDWFGGDIGMGVSHFETLLDNGSWENVGMNMTRNYTNLSEGLHSFSVQVFDVLGNNVSGTVSFKVDTGTPTLTIVSPAEGALLNSSSVTVRWTGADNVSGIALYEVRFDNAGWFGVGPDTDRNLTGLSEGAHSAEVRATDQSGNQMTASVSFTVDTVAPALTVFGPSGIVAATTAAVSWNCTDATTGVALMETRLDTAAWADAGANSSRQLAGLTDGAHDFELRAKDRAGNIASQTIRFTVDATPPAVTITSPAAGDTIRSSNLTASWTGSDAVSGLALFEVRLDGGDWLRTGTGLLYNFQNVPDGNHTVQVRATDRAGNEQVVNSSFTVDTKPVVTDITAPTIVSTAPSGLNIRVVQTVVITFSEPIDPSSFRYSCSPDPGSWTILWNANFTQAVLLHADFAYKTVYSFTVSGAKDRAGNSLNGSSNFSFTTVKMTTAPKPVSTGVDASLLAIPIVLIIVLVIALFFVMSRGPKAPKATVEPAAVAPPPAPVAPVATAPEPEKAHKGKMRSKPGVVSPAASTQPAVVPPSKPDDIDIDDIDIDDEEEFKP